MSAGAGGPIDFLQIPEGALGGGEGEDRVPPSGDDDHGFGGEEAEEIRHIGDGEEPRHIIIRAMIDGEQGVAEGAEIAGRHGGGDAREEGGGEEGDGSAAGIAHDADARRVGIAALEQIIDAAIDIEDPFPEEGTAEEEGVHGGVMASVRGELFLAPFTPFAERALFDAEGGVAPAQAAEGEIAIAVDGEGAGFGFALHGDGGMHAGGMALQADHEGIGRGAPAGQADIGGHIGEGFGGEDDFFDGAQGMFALPDPAGIQRDARGGEGAHEPAEFAAKPGLPGGDGAAGESQGGDDAVGQAAVIVGG